jgi:UDP-N-acetyl-D-glucosamine dehydrogenase
MANKKDKRLTVVGLGYVGLPLALLAERKGYEVTGLDVDETKIATLQSGRSPFVDPEVTAAMKKTAITFTTDAAALENADVIAICVPTPVTDNHMPDLKPLIGATESVAKHLQKGQLVIIESTINPGVSEEAVLPILEEISGLKAGKNFHLAHCPERINPGDTTWHIEKINRVVGSFDQVGLRRAADFYRSILDADVRPMGSLKEAEAVKIVENSFRDINIAFVNELAMSFSRLGIDVVNVINGASTKPFAFMAHFPGCGVGGHCIPVDPYYMIEYGKQHGFHHDFLSLARRINNAMPEFTVEQVVSALNEKKRSLKGATIAVLGLSYKPDIDDRRESPSYELIKLLKKRGADVRVYDPFVPEESDVKSLNEALKGAGVALIATAHSVFKKITPVILKKAGVDILVDGRNCLNKETFQKAGITYRGIGR